MPKKPPRRKSVFANLAHSQDEIDAARARLYDYVATYKDYMMRDRDILLLAMYTKLEKLTK